MIEKGGVNFSEVYGTFNDKFAKLIPGTEKSKEFWASGVSLIMHPKSPLVPIIHLNTRFICTEGKAWFGGGIDLTPSVKFDEDTQFFHDGVKQVCEQFSDDYYPKFKQEADDYFYVKHRKESRGIGGIFYDYLGNDYWDGDFAFNREVGKSFIKLYPQLVRKHMYENYDNEHKKMQNYRRMLYVEFNLLYDRGTIFGLETGGNIDAILASLPPAVGW